MSSAQRLVALASITPRATRCAEPRLTAPADQDGAGTHSLLGRVTVS